MVHIQYWIHIEQELSDLMKSFGSVFQVDNFEFDSENVWEWIEGYSQPLNAEINITREHQEDKGEYNKPMQIRIKFTDLAEIPEDLIHTLGETLSKKLKTGVSYGKIRYIKGNLFDFEELKKYEIR